ncbi:MAG: AgmX/PglI C-terminal domain-containing protein [Myxococcota bacterium]
MQLPVVSRLGLSLLFVVGCQGKSAPAPAPKGDDEASTPASPANAEPSANGFRKDGPKVQFGELLLEGPRDGGELLQVVGQNVGLLQDCYAATLADTPDVAGELGIRFFIKGDGSVPDAILANAKITNRPLQRCLMKTFKTLTFAATGHEGKATLPIFFGDVAPPVVDPPAAG